jgi:drug/metabolite transporter (DMT)-like permease
VGLVLLVQPAVAAIIGWLAFGEHLSTTDFIGAAIIAVALVLIRLPAGAARKEALEE